jgi:hypothetical protein
MWPAPHMTEFYLQTPLDQALLRYVTHGEVHLLAIFAEAVEYGASAARLASGLVPALARARADTDAGPICALLCSLLANGDAETRACILDRPLFRMLATAPVASMADVAHIARHAAFDRFDDEPATLSADEVAQAIDVMGDVVERCAACLDGLCVEARRPVLPQHLAALALVEQCARYEAWRPSLVQLLVHVGRRSWWTLEFGALLGAMLDTPSVEFVVRLHTKGRLASLVRYANAYAKAGQAVWRAVRAQLRGHWPAEFDAALPPELAPTTPRRSSSERASVPSPVSPAACCPITLQAYRNPVVASDGHTYERDSTSTGRSCAEKFSSVARASLSSAGCRTECERAN